MSKQDQQGTSKDIIWLKQDIYLNFLTTALVGDGDISLSVNPHTDMRGPHGPQNTLIIAPTVIIGTLALKTSVKVSILHGPMISIKRKKK